MISLSHIRRVKEKMMACLLCECLQQHVQVPDYDPGPGLCLLCLLALLEQPCWPFLYIQHTVHI